jgi:hypothetical protein
VRFDANVAERGALFMLRRAGQNGSVAWPAVALGSGVAGSGNIARSSGGVFYTDASTAAELTIDFVRPVCASTAGCALNDTQAVNGPLGFAAPSSYNLSVAVLRVRPGATAPPFSISVFDAFGDPVAAWPQLSASVAAFLPDAVTPMRDVLTGATVTVYESGAATFNLLTLSAPPGTALVLLVTLSASTLGAPIDGASVALNVTVAPCASADPLSVYDDALGACVCAAGAAPPPGCSGSCVACPPGTSAPTSGSAVCTANPAGFVAGPPPPSPLPPSPTPTPAVIPPSAASHVFNAGSVVVTTVNGTRVITVPDRGANENTAPLAVQLSGLTSLTNYAFVLEGSPSPTDDVINGLVLTGMSAPFTGGLSVTMTAKYTIHTSAEPLVANFSDNHYR